MKPVGLSCLYSFEDGVLSSEAIAENVRRVATTGDGELEVSSLKKYIQYCKSRCIPLLSEEASDVLASSYVKIRNDVRKRQVEVNVKWQNGTIL
mmetsp:Transcript_22482/g.51832  ORF Transcript_22482/g.51832 Transcript_22482/m.51832 type:complete len:94 (-) Transcript_22482:95-376(-)